MVFFKRQLKSMRKDASPRRVFAKRLEGELHAAWDEAYPAGPVRWRVPRFATVGVASLVLVFTMGTGVYAYESPEVVEGHPLYFMKAGVEYMEGRAAFSAQAQARYHAKMMDRRMEEGEHHFFKGQERPPHSLEEAAQRFEAAVEVLSERIEDDQTREEVLQLLEKKHARYLLLHARVLESEDGAQDHDPLEERVRDRRLSDDEFNRLFGAPGRPPGARSH